MPDATALQPMSALPVYRTLLLAIDHGVATITLNRPRQRNAVGDGMRDELADAYLTCDQDDGVRAIVLTGAPPAFCAGADLGEGEDTFAAPGPGFTAAGVDGASLDAVQAGDRRGQRSRDRAGSDAGAAVRHPVLRRRRALRRGAGQARCRRRRLLALGPASAGRHRERRRNPLDRRDFRWAAGRGAGAGQPRARCRRRAAGRSGRRTRHRGEHRADVGGGQQAAAVGLLRPRSRGGWRPRDRDTPAR